MSDHDERLQKYIAGELTPDERASFEDEVLSNTEIADELYADANLSAALKISARAGRNRAVSTVPAQPWWRWRTVRWLTPAVAVAAVAMIMLLQPGDSQVPDEVFRGDGAQFQAVGPQGDVEVVPSQFVWSALDGAAFYRFELFDSASQPVFETVTADTSLTLDLTTIEVPTSGYWLVTPLNDLRVGAGGTLLTRYRKTN